MPRVTRAIFFGIALSLLPVSLSGQERDCDFAMRDPTGRTVREQGTDIYLIYDAFIVNCDDGAQLRANSGRYDQRIGEVYLVGDVYFEDGDRILTSNEATYDTNISRLHARGDVVFIDRAEGSTLRGPDLVYYQATEERPLSQMTAIQRPTLSLTPPESAEIQEPLELVADRVTMSGDDDLSAFGSVVITRSDFTATSGEARYNVATEDLELREKAVIRGEEFELTGEVVQTRVADGSIEYLHSRTDAALRGEEIDVEASDLQLFFHEGALQRAVAQVPANGSDRAIARSSTFRMEADSLDATFVDEQLEVVVAIGSAYAATIDTMAVTVITPAARDDEELDGDPVAADPAESVLDSDWIRGDTIVGNFAVRETPDDIDADPLQVQPDPAIVDSQDGSRPSVELRRLVARGSAQSLYRVAGEGDAAEQRRNVNFLVGEVIELDLAEGELQVAHVEGLQVGVYLEADPPADASGAETDATVEPASPDGQQSDPAGVGE